MKNKLYVGIDVCKKHLDIAIRPEGKIWQVENNEQGIEKLVEDLGKIKPELIVMESTGGYELNAACELGTAELPIAVINPRQARDFAKSLGKLAKTDKIDAMVLAHFGEAIQPEPRKMPDEKAILLQATISRRRQLIQMLTAEKNRLGTAHISVKKQIREHISWIENELAIIDVDLQKQLRSDPRWKVKEKILRSFSGVGPVTSVTLLADFPEIGIINRKKGAALAGLAPFNCDSGNKHGKRIIWGGRASVRNALYMATLSAVRCNPVIRPYYLKLIERGKPPKVALVACMRKVLTILNSMIRDMTYWQPDLALPKNSIST